MADGAQLIRHLWRTQPERIAAGSYLDCHVRGLHSVMFVDAPGSVIRMFIATHNHQMGRNFLPLDELSIAFHSHDAELTLHAVAGDFANITFERAAEGERLIGYRYQSKIRDGRGGFVANDDAITIQRRRQWVTTGESIYMRATEFHTIAVVPGTFAAWFVYEGAKDPEYQPVAYSNGALEEFSADGLYRRPTVAQVRELIAQVYPGLG